MKEYEETKNLTEDLIKEVYIDEYRELLNDAMSAIKKMEEAGYDKDEIISLFTHEPLAKWGKATERVLETPYNELVVSS